MFWSKQIKQSWIQSNIIKLSYLKENHENELLKLSRDRAHHQHDAYTSFWLLWF